METYCKIQTVFKRDPETKYKTLLEGQYSMPEFEYLAENDWVFTEKVDGTNIRVGLSGGAVTFGGRTDNAQIPAFLVQKLMEIFPVEKMVEAFPDMDGDVCLYGEGYGAKIQKGGGDYIADGCGFALFDVRVGGWWLTRESVADIAEKLDIYAVPVVGRGTLAMAIDLVRGGQDSVVAAGRRMSEGLVMRPAVELASRSGHRIIAKIKHKDFQGA